MKKYFTLKNISAIAIFSAVSVILACVPGLQFSIPGFPSFLQLHFDEIPILISSFAYGPFVGVLVLIIKSLIRIPLDINNMCIGVFADFLYGIFLILPASVIYKKYHNFKGAIIGLLVGGLANLFVSSVLGLYIIYPLYGLLLGEQTVINFFLIVPGLQDLTSLTDPRIIYMVLIPFNLIRISIVLVVTLLIYKPIRFIIDFKSKQNKKDKNIEEKKIEK